MTKSLFLSTCFLLLGFHLKAQILDCQKFRNGTFKMTYEGKKGIIKRYKDVQEEYLNGDGKPTMIFSVKWINDCTYTLTPTAATRKSLPDIPKDAIMTVNIIRTTANGYTYSATYSWDKKKVYNNTLTLIK
jgi:hypothetical protein